MAPMDLPEWLVILIKYHFDFVCILICFVSTSIMVVVEKCLINSGQFARNILSLLCTVISSAGIFASLIAYRSAFHLGFGQGTPDSIKEEAYAVGTVTALVAFVLAYRDMKDK